MAKRVIYNGPTRQLGRFGKVKTGQTITLTEREWGTCRSDPNFKLDATGRNKGAEPVNLQDTIFFRFTRLRWGTPQVLREVHRKGRNQLAAMAKGLEHLGIACDLSADMGREEMADTVLESAGNAGWLAD